MKENKNKYSGIIGTVLYHAVILLILFLLSFTTSLPLPGEEGVEVNLGYSDKGSGEIQPEKPELSKAEPSPSSPKQSEEDEEIVTQDTEESPVVEKKKENTPVKKKEKPDKKAEPVKEEPVVNPAALYKGKSKTTSEGGSEGITGKEGDQGNPNGTPDSDNYQGQGGLGDGLSFSLSGRSPKYLPKPSRNFSENGTVVVQIDVDKYGKVVKAIAIDKGSNTTNANLRSLAEQAARQAIFNAKPDAAEVQRGTITYHFIVKD